MRLSVLACAVAVAALLLLGSRPAAGCSCTNQLTLQEEFDAAAMVFAGRVTDLQTDPFGNLGVVFEPLQRWKGPLDYTVYLVTPPNSAACGFPFELGRDYLVFATLVPYGLTYSPMPYTHLCAKTSLLAGNPWLAQLPTPLVTTAAPPPTWGTLKIRYR